MIFQVRGNRKRVIMPPTTTLFRAARPAFRPNLFTQQFTRQTRTRFVGRRWQSTAAPAEPIQQSLFKKLWNSPVGLKTVHFWAPIMKWAIVIAGISDFYRPAEKLSLTQNVALTCTGAIWTRWCLIIKPRNILLAAVNFFLGVVGVIQVSRIVTYNMSHKGETLGEQVKEAGEDIKDVGKELKVKVEDAVKS